MSKSKNPFKIVFFLSLIPSLAFGKCDSADIETRYIKGLDNLKFLTVADNSKCGQLLRLNPPANIEHTAEMFSPLQFEVSACIEKPFNKIENCHLWLIFYNKSSKRDYKWFHSITLFVDGAEENLGSTSREIELITDYEKMTIDVNYEQLLKLANAKTITGKVFLKTDFLFSECEFCQLRAMVKIIKKYYKLE